MQIIRKIEKMQRIADNLRRQNKIIGFVPTMGYLHKGHLNLVKLAKEKSDIVVMSIYVNPTQFGPNEDFSKYPRNFERDEKLAKEEGVDIIFYPRSMYKNNLTFVNVEKITKILCGASRPIHFRGVATIVTKLFNIVKPHYAVFGQKDAQQAAVIQKLIDDLDFDIKLILSPIIREDDGLAVSSRNVNLTKENRRNAPILYKSLCYIKEQIDQGKTDLIQLIKQARKMIDDIPNAKIDYYSAVSYPELKSVSKLEQKTLIALAVNFGNVRLIDNIIIENYWQLTKTNKNEQGKLENRN